MKQFLQDLSRRKENWQVRQAEEVIALYRFYQTTLTQVPQQGDSLCADSSHWDTAQTRLIEALRLKHRSLSTEQSYQSIRPA